MGGYSICLLGKASNDTLTMKGGVSGSRVIHVVQASLNTAHSSKAGLKSVNASPYRSFQGSVRDTDSDWQSTVKGKKKWVLKKMSNYQLMHGFTS